MIRRFTVLATVNCDLLTLSIRDLLKMKLEFPKIFLQLFKGVRKQLNTELDLKIEVIKLHEESKLHADEGKGTNKLRAKFNIMLLGGLQKRLNQSDEEEGAEGQEGDDSAKKSNGQEVSKEISKEV